jgi:anthranilate-CoA ligase
MNLAERLLRPTGVDPQRGLYIYCGETVTRARVSDAVTAAAAGFRRIGVAADDRVVLMLYDTPALPILFLAAVAVGAIPIAVNPMLRRLTLTHILADSGAAVLVVERDQLQRIAAEMNPLVGTALVVQDMYPAGDHADASDVPHVTTWLDAGPDGFDGFHPQSADSIAFWQYTSGTTGQPKAVCHTQHGMLASTSLFAQGVLGLGPDDRIYSVPKMFFGYGQGNSLFFPLLTGATACLDSRWPTPSLVLENVRTFRPSVLFAVPTIYHQMLHGRDLRAADLSSVRIAFSAGAPLKALTFERWRSEYGIEILDGIGATEVGHVFLTNHPGRARSARTGTPVAGYDVRLIDAGGQAVAANGEGVLLVSGPSVSAGYWQRPAETAAKFEGGWYRTGDRFRRDESGYYEYLGREDDLFKVHGRWVAPLEIENLVLASHEDVTEAAVVAVETEMELCVPVLFVAAKIDDDAHAADLEARVLGDLAGRLEEYKLPRHCWAVSELPRNDNGKVVRARLAEQAATLLRDAAARTA